MDLKTSTVLRIYRTTSVVLIRTARSAAVYFSTQHHLRNFRDNCEHARADPNRFPDAPIATAFTHDLELDELLELLRDTKRELSPGESKQLMQQLSQIRARLLQDSSLKRSKP